MFDEDNDKQSPLALHEDIRVIIAQDDTGVSLNRLLFDSAVVGDAKDTSKDVSRQSPKILSFSRASIQTESPRGSGFIRSQPVKDTRKRSITSPTVSEAPTSPSGFFGQSSHIRRMPAHTSLADARHNPELPIENSRDEMDSWLDCVFGKSQMKYKGENTKLHIIQRQPADAKLAMWEKESQRGGFELCPEPNAPLPKLKQEEMIKLRKPALLVSRAFTVPLQNEDLPEALCRKTAPNPHSSMNKSDLDWTKSLPKVYCTTPTFAVTILLSLEKRSDHNDASDGQMELIINNWHTISRALDALEHTAAAQILLKLKAEVEAMSRQYTDGLPPSSRMLRLKPAALQENKPVSTMSEHISTRIGRAFNILDVGTRNEWNIWRDELRDNIRSGKGTDAAKIGFIRITLTAALSSSLSWMRIFAPPHLQARLQREARVLEDNYSKAQSRTIVISSDHNLARQIIYILSKFMPLTQPATQFARSSTTVNSCSQVSALTQGLMSVKHEPVHLEAGSRNGHGHDRGHSPALDMPVFEQPAQSVLSISPVKQSSSLSTPKACSPSKLTIQRKTSRLDITSKATPVMAIASAPNSSYPTPSGSPEMRPSSSASAQSDLLRHIQRNNSALSETSTESGSFWNSLRSASFPWGIRRASTATSESDGGAGLSASQRGDALTSILKGGKTSVGRSGGKKLVRMVEEADELQIPHDDEPGDRKDSAIQTPTHSTSALKIDTPGSFSQMLEYTYDAAASVVDVQLLGEHSGKKACKVPTSGHHFPSQQNKDFSPPIHPPEEFVTSHAMYDKIAGYLERVHPDFALQAVRPYQRLEDDVKRSMLGERSPKGGCGVSDPQLFPLEHWVDVCSTVLIDADTMTVKRLTLRRRVRYSLTRTDDALKSDGSEIPHNAIKITKSQEMDAVKRTYKRDDHGNKVDWKDTRVVRSENDSLSDSNGSSMTASHDRLEVGSNGTRPSEPSNPPQARQPSISESPVIINLNGKPQLHYPSERSIGDDLSSFIDVNAKKTHKHKVQPSISNTRRVPTRDKDGKITGWKDLDTDEPEEQGLHDLPTSFINSKRERVMPAINERTLEEVFDEETIIKPDHYVNSLLEQMLASSSDARSTAPSSRAGSLHGRTHGRSNSLMGGSGLTELQHESKKIVEDTLEDLVASVMYDKYSPSPPRSAGGFFGFRVGARESSESSILRQSISKWLHEE